ncbi:MAG: ATP-binding protein [Pseudomonadota bacterium]|nr:ATP-binding protein [Pseudomonadota bacterium]
MKVHAAPLPANEKERIEALYRLKILDTEPEAHFDDLTALAAALTNCPIALVSLIDVNRQWFKARCGIDGTETDRSLAFCAHALLGNDIMEIPDARLDPRFAQNPLVLGPPHIAFYAGMPLMSAAGLCYGTLCVVDTQPRRLGEQQRGLLRKLGNQVLRHMEAHVERQQSVSSSLMLARLLEFLPDGLITAELDGTLRHVNSIAREWHGVDPGTVPKERWQEYFQLCTADGETRLPLAQNPVARVLRGEKVRDEELVIRARGQADRTVLCNGDFLVDDRGAPAGAVVVMHDLSEQRRTERMKDEFLSTVSHELRTPLTAISGALSLVQSGVLGEVPEPMRELITVAARNSQRLSSIINDLLDMDKLLAGKMNFCFEHCALISVLDEALATMRSYAELYGVQLVRRGDVPATIDVDTMRLTQVLTNLLSNACKFAPRGSEVVLEHRVEGGSVVISVIDTGLGIPDAFKARLFQKFSQADTSDSNRKGGTGLGLVICKELIERMHGAIGFESAAGQGTRFWCRLPLIS